jgi:sialate O-acetylesterase
MFFRQILLFPVLLAFVSPVSAGLRLPGFLGDHMVLQQQAPIPLWGWAEPEASVVLQLDRAGAEPVTATAGKDGTWRVTLPAMTASSDPMALTVTSGSETISVKDILGGEVWLCSGQSNMEWTVNSSLNAPEEIAAAKFPQIRQVKVAKLTAATPQGDVDAPWLVCSPETAGGFTAAGYFMARELHRELGVPIGLLNISWGGTRIEPWTPVEGFAEVPALNEIRLQVERTLPGSELYRSGLSEYIQSVSAWVKTAETALQDGVSASPSPAFPGELNPLTAHTAPTTIFNAMMNPFVGYGMRGAIWYQGESNHVEGMLYAEKKKALVAGWRKLWGIGEFPFYFVQIAPFRYGEEDPSILPLFWEAQSACLEIPNTGMVVINDIGNIEDIHPKNKQEVGRRLSLLAMKSTYGKPELAASGPVFKDMTLSGATLRVRFDEVAGGLKSRDGKPLSHFEMIGEQAEFVPATATIEGGDTVVLSSDQIQTPAAMRFAWHKLAEPNLTNGAGLPTSAFRAGEVPDYDFLPLKVPEAAEYELIYDLDLKTLAPVIPYSVDRSAEVAGAFDRVGYFMELDPADGPRQWAWVSMESFTDDLKKIAIPTVASGASFQSGVKNLTILSNVEGVASGTNLEGNLEFWPNNYGPENSASLAGASATIWDFGDAPMSPGNGYGSMQVHHTTAKTTVFAINQWNAGPNACLGIGNSSADPKTKDWTFVSNAKTFETARLRVLVRRKQ